MELKKEDKEILINKYNNEILYLRSEKHHLHLEQNKILKDVNEAILFDFNIKYLEYKNIEIEKDKISNKINVLLEKIKFIENPYLLK